MEEQTNDLQNHPHREIFPRWLRVLWIIIGIGLLVGLVVLIVKAGRRAGPALAVAAGAAVAGTAMGKRAPKRMTPPIDRGFVQSRLQEAAQHLLQTEGSAVFTPTELFRFLNILLEKAELTLFTSTQEMARLLESMGLKSQVQSVAGRSERRWYDLAGYGTHDAPAQ